MTGELKDFEIEHLLKSEVVGRIGCSADGLTYVIPITYAYEDNYVYAHSAEGLKINIMRKNPMVCFEIDIMKDMRNWKSVVVQGLYDELKGPARLMGIQKLIKHLQSLNYSETSLLDYVLSERERDDPLKSIIYRLKVIRKTGRFESTTEIEKSPTSSMH